ncbi:MULTISPECIES: NlpC/P60 family protein [unclassified Nocardiopsis]|uniref:NlpC/P60 family protein n=1 Tax=unclassified Nocardiopsis TaxID=2649073 RepID=UPI001357AAB6|nr:MULTISPECIES: NlpC/P60 family protein [unclassified Nocardiopsis]
MADGIGDAYLSVRPDLDGFGREVLRKLGPALRAAEREADKSGGRFGVRFGRAADRAISASLRGVGRAAFANLVATAGAASVAVAGAVAPASGALLAIPAAAGVAGAAIATLAVGTRGMGDAMTAVAEGDAEALNEALEELSPNAREFVRSWDGLAGAFAPIQQATQDRLFSGLAEELDSLTAGGALPVLETGLGDVADSLNGLAREAVSAAGSPLFQGQLADVFSGTAEATSSFEGAVAPLMSVLAELVSIGLPLVTRFGEWSSGALTSAAAFLSSEQGAQRMTEIVERSVEVLGQLGRIGSNLAGLLGGIFGGASADGQSLLDTIERLTGEWAAWAQSAQGQEQISEVFGLLVGVFENLLGLVPVVAGVIGQVSSAFQSLPGPVQDVVSSSLAWSILLGPLLARVTSLAPLAKVAAGGVGLLAKGAAATVGALGQFASGLRSAQAAQSAFSGAAGTFGGAVRRGWDTAVSAARSGASRVASGASSAATAVRSAGTAAVSTAASWGRLAASQTAAAAAATRARVATVAATVAQKAASVATRVWSVAQWALNVAMSANPLGLIVVAIIAVIAAVVLAYQRFEWFRNLVQAVFSAVAAVGRWLWNKILKPFFTWVGSFLKGTVGPAFSRFNSRYVQPALKAVGAIVKWLWQKVGKPIFGLYVSYLKNVLGPIFLWLWRSIIRPAMNGVGSVVRTVWTKWVSPAFSALRSGVSRVASSFRTGVEAIKRHWNKVKDAARKPVKWVIDTVYTGGVKKMWDSVATKVNLPKLPAVKFASGGVLPGYAPGHDSILAMLSPGEAILRPEVTRWLGADTIHGLNAMARTGRLPAYAGGGIVGSIGSAVGGFLDGAKDLWTDGLRAAAKVVLDPMVEGARKVLGDTEWGAMIAEIPARLVDKLLSWFDAQDSKLGGGKTAREAIKHARSQLGVPYSWGGGGPGGPSFGFAQGANIRGFDCSSLMQYALTKAGLTGVPRVSQAQMSWTKKVSSPAPGDLGFPHPGHVWMATVKGGGRIIEAPRTGLNVRERSFSGSVQKWGRPQYRELATGGIVTRPLHALVGEAGPEAVIPLRRGLDDLAARIGDAIRLPERDQRTPVAPVQPITVNARTDADPHAIAAAIQRRMTLLRNAGVVGPAAPVGGAV